MHISSKKLKGQYFTKQNPFQGDLFQTWIKLLPENEPILEPFAGSGNLFQFISANWHGYDLEPQSSNIKQNDSILNFPTGYKVCITNPPYLAQTVISRSKLDIVLVHADMYLDCIDLCLQHCDYVAAIVPSTFFNQPLFKERLFAWDKIDYKMFDDTDTPVGVAYFVPCPGQEPLLGVNGNLLTFDGMDIPFKTKSTLVFNPPDPTHTLVAIDSISGPNIHIKEYLGEEIKSTNRHIVPIKGLSCSADKLNLIINEWRRNTCDFWLTSFMSCQANGSYRKRITFNTLHWLANISDLYSVPEPSCDTTPSVNKTINN